MRWSRLLRSLGAAAAALTVLLAAAPTAPAQDAPARPGARTPKATEPRPRRGPPPAPEPVRRPMDPLQVGVNAGVIAVLVGCLAVTAARRRRGEVPAWHVKAALGVTVAGTMSSAAGLLGTQGGAGRVLLLLSIPAWLACVGYFFAARRAEKRALAAAVAARRRKARP